MTAIKSSAGALISWIQACDNFAWTCRIYAANAACAAGRQATLAGAVLFIEGHTLNVSILSSPLTLIASDDHTANISDRFWVACSTSNGSGTSEMSMSAWAVRSTMANQRSPSEEKNFCELEEPTMDDWDRCWWANSSDCTSTFFSIYRHIRTYNDRLRIYIYI